MSRAARRFMANRGAVVGTLLICILLAIAIVGPLLTTHDPLAGDIDHGLTTLGAPLPPSGNSLLGTDHLGRDVWSRVVAGAGTSLEVVTLSTLLAVWIGLVVGLTAGYAGRAIDNGLMRLVDLVLAFPFTLVAILLASLFREAHLASSTAPVVLTLGIVGWTTLARVVRGKTLALAKSEFVTAARAIGASPFRIVVRHILPNVAGVLIVMTALVFAQNLLAESVLSYLGLGPPPPTPSWGRMLYEGRVYYRTAPWLTIAPGAAILLVVVAFNLLGEGLRDYFDPKERR
jgi:peptide/nickel transport system permease protein